MLSRALHTAYIPFVQLDLHVKVPGYSITSGLESTEELRLRG